MKNLPVLTAEGLTQPGNKAALQVLYVHLVLSIIKNHGFWSSSLDILYSVYSSSSSSSTVWNTVRIQILISRDTNRILIRIHIPPNSEMGSSNAKEKCVWFCALTILRILIHQTPKFETTYWRRLEVKNCIALWQKSKELCLITFSGFQTVNELPVVSAEGFIQKDSSSSPKVLLMLFIPE